MGIERVSTGGRVFWRIRCDGGYVDEGTGTRKRCPNVAETPDDGFVPVVPGFALDLRDHSAYCGNCRKRGAGAIGLRHAREAGD